MTCPQSLRARVQIVFHANLEIIVSTLAEVCAYLKRGAVCTSVWNSQPYPDRAEGHVLEGSPWCFTDMARVLLLSGTKKKWRRGSYSMCLWFHITDWISGSLISFIPARKYKSRRPEHSPDACSTWYVFSLVRVQRSPLAVLCFSFNGLAFHWHHS